MRKPIFSILSSKRGITPTKIDGNWQHWNLICSTVKESHMQNFSLIYQSMLEKSAENCVFQYSRSQKGHNSYKNWRHSNLISSTVKVKCKISAQYVKACKNKMRKTVYFQFSTFQKGHNSHKNWRKLTTLELDL